MNCKECTKQFTCKKCTEQDRTEQKCTDKIKFSEAGVFEPERIENER